MFRRSHTLYTLHIVGTNTIEPYQGNLLNDCSFQWVWCNVQLNAQWKWAFLTLNYMEFSSEINHKFPNFLSVHFFNGWLQWHVLDWWLSEKWAEVKDQWILERERKETEKERRVGVAVAPIQAEKSRSTTEQHSFFSSNCHINMPTTTPMQKRKLTFTAHTCSEFLTPPSRISREHT